MQVARGIHRLGPNSMINAYLVDDGGKITVVDAGVAGLYRDLASELASMGRTIEDVRASVLTHGHSDHIGFAERIRVDRAISVSIHEADAALARGEAPNPSKGFGKTRAAPLIGFLWFSLIRGGLRTKHVGQVSVFGDGATLDVPGSPRVILTPGHTPGSTVLDFSSHRALLVGDALSTYAVTTGSKGPQIAPFTADPTQALESLSRIEGMSADVVLPGHGDPWMGGVDEAIRRVRMSASGRN